MEAGDWGRKELVEAGDERSGSRKGLVEVGDERSGSRGYGGGGTRATRLVGEERSGSKGRGWGMRRAIGLELSWWGWETSARAQRDTEMSVRA